MDLTNRAQRFPISRDPHKGGTRLVTNSLYEADEICFQFLGIPTKGELAEPRPARSRPRGCFQFLGIPTKGEHYIQSIPKGIQFNFKFPISRDPHKGGTYRVKT